MTKRTYRQLLCAVDLASASDRVLQRATSVREAAGAELTVLSVLDPVPPDFAIAGAAGALPPGLMPESERLEIAHEKLNAITSELGQPAIKTHVEVGPVVDVILEHARDTSADLIVLGSHGRSGLSRVLGSTASAVVHLASCDVLTVRLQD